MSMLLEIKNLYGGYEEGVDILQGIDLTVAEGEAVGIIGLNGSGKSTFGKAIMNMIPFRRGEILFEGEDITSLTTNQLAHRGISIMQQGGKVFRNLSVWDNLQFAAQGNNSRFSIFNSQLAEIIPLLQRPKKDLRHLMADKLSGGQKHQLSLAMTLATNPRLVILDEPSAGLSPKAVDEMYAMLDVVHKYMKMSIVLIEQNISHVLSYCDRCVMFSQGVISHEFLGDELIISEVERMMFKN